MTLPPSLTRWVFRFWSQKDKTPKKLIKGVLLASCSGVGLDTHYCLSAPHHYKSYSCRYAVSGVNLSSHAAKVFSSFSLDALLGLYTKAFKLTR